MKSKSNTLKILITTSEASALLGNCFRRLGYGQENRKDTREKLNRGVKQNLAYFLRINQRFTGKKLLSSNVYNAGFKL